MRKIGRVIELQGTRATVCFEPAETCKKCDAAALCQGAGSRHTVVVENPAGARVGDEVFVEQAPGKALLSAFLVFGLPVLLAVFGLIIGARWGDLWSMIGGLSAFALGLIVAKVVNDLLAKSPWLMPRVSEVRQKEGS